MAVEQILEKLEKVTHRGSGSWTARCPAHDDRSPSLSVKETSDGTILLHCFGGCDTGAVLEAMGLEMEDLFPEPLPHRKGARRQFTLAEAFRAISFEGTVICMIAAEFLEQGKITEADSVRLAQAVRRITDAFEFCHGRA